MTREVYEQIASKVSRRSVRKGATAPALPATPSAAYAIPGLKEKEEQVQHLNPMEHCLLIKQRVCAYFQITPEQIEQKGKSTLFRQARQIAMYLSDKQTTLPLKAIGELYGGRDHTTVIHARQVVKNEIGSGSDLDCYLREILDGKERRIGVVNPSPFTHKPTDRLGDSLVEKVAELRRRGHTKEFIKESLKISLLDIDRCLTIARKWQEAYTV